MFVTAFIAKPGKRTYAVKAEMMKDIFPHQDSDERLIDAVSTEYFFHQMKIEPRTEAVPSFAKKTAKGPSVVEGFSKGSSVFGSWREPTANVY